MTVQAIVSKPGVVQFTGLSSDTKPAAASFSGCSFTETDTQKVYVSNGVSWTLTLNNSYPTGSGTVSGTNTGDNAINSLYSGLAASKQDALVSGTNIKTINGSSVLGSGNLTVTAGDPSYSPGSFTVATETWRIQGNHVKLTGSQRATIQGTGRLRISN